MREKDGKEQLTSDLTEAVTASQVTQAVQKQRKVDLHEQLLFMNPIREAGVTLSPCPGLVDVLQKPPLLTTQAVWVCATHNVQ